MFAVKKIEPGTLLKHTHIGLGVALEVRSPNSVTWGIVEDGRVFFEPSVLTGEMHPSIWPTKRVAEQVLAHMS